jgi:all-trans-retinol 13,14-reductase
MWKNNLIFASGLIVFCKMDAFDVVVIGSGIGGLLSAVMLAREGMHVAVVEQNKQIGGCLQTFSFHKKVFDSCVHYISALDEGQTQQRIFHHAGIMPHLKLRRLDENGFDRIIFSDERTVYPYAQGLNNFKECLLPYFKNAGNDLDNYLATVRHVTASFPLYNLRNGEASEKAAVSGLSLDDVFNKLQDEKLKQVLLGNNLLYAGCHQSTPFYIHALVNKSYMDSAYKCDGGSSQISKLLWKELQQLGGVIFRNEKVIKLEEKDGKITSALTESGNQYFGKQFIANAHPATVLQWVDSKIIKPVYRNRIAAARNSISAFMLNIVLKPGKVPYPNHNIYWNRDSKDSLAATHYQAADWPANYALYYNEDPDQPSFAESVTVLTYMHVKEWDEWAGSYNAAVNPNERALSYHAFKLEKEARLMDCVGQRYPEINEHAIASKAATPLTFRDYMGSPDGSIYGIMADVKHPEKTQIPIRTKFSNLLLTGQNIGVHGVLGVSINAVAVCGELLGLDYLLQKINQPYSS